MGSQVKHLLALAALCAGCGGQTDASCPLGGSLTATLRVQDVEVPVCPQTIAVNIDSWQVGGTASIEGEVCSNVLQNLATCKVTIDCPGNIVANFTATSSTEATSVLVQQGGCIYVSE